ncbi:flavin-containing monooxygenase [Streptomyces fulvoviolaceus]|uniref:flavin-containing monooxygenase n=1 Tax=Streptomyces fulvoviolaceus TaxID=285535 RepID=UPI0004CB7218|nr:NAD(P)/FAD-dependent oxidoreductase [Streptomyces fulvoviolaceus]
MSPRVIVIGAGFGGIAVGIGLLQAGVEHLTVLDKGDRVGGVWRDNDYPDCACDIPAVLYSFSFALNPDWSCRFPPRAEIQSYLEDIVERFGLRPHLRLRTEVTAATFDEDTQTWSVETASGDRLECDVLVSAVGQLARPVTPQIDGLGSFGGASFHSAEWDETVDLDGRRVAVVGTGASAIQIVPAIAERAAQVTVFQRSAPWTLPKPNRRYGSVKRLVGRAVPATLKAGRAATWAVTSAMSLAVTGNSIAGALFTAVSTGQRRLQVRDRALREKVTPDYDMGCKRVLFTSRWYPALERSTVDVVTDPVERVTPSGIVTADGVEHLADVLVFGTGFAATEFLVPMTVTGRGGTQLAEYWKDGAHAYLGMTVPDFPNLFLVYGPNTNTGSTSVVYFHEAQARYIVQAVRLLSAMRGGTLEVREEVEGDFDRELQTRLGGMVWSGCESWYRTSGGRTVTNWPGMAGEYRRRTARLDPADYLVTAPVNRSAPAPAAKPRRRAGAAAS